MKHIGRLNQVTGRTFEFTGKINDKHVVGFITKIGKESIIELHEAESVEEIAVVKNARFNLPDLTKKKRNVE